MMTKRGKETKVKRVCSNHPLTHSKAKKVFKQLGNHPELCENCPIKTCMFVKYVWGDKK